MTFYSIITVIMIIVALARYRVNETNGWGLTGEILIALVPGINFLYFVYIMMAS